MGVETEAAVAPDERCADDHPGLSVRRRWWRFGWRDGLAVGLPAAVYALHAAYYGPWIVDDAAITFAYARSLSEGLGPVLQPGAAPVEGFSNPTWMAVLTVARVLGLFDRGTVFGLPDIVLFPKLLAGACVVGVLAAFHAVVRALARPWWVTALIGSVCVLVPSFTIWTTSGLENGLFVLLVVALGAVLARAALRGDLFASRTALVCGLLAAVATLTRPDGLVYVAAHPALVLLVGHRGRWGAAMRVAATSLAAAAVPVAVYLAWRLATFGDWLPTTARAKAQGVPGPAELGKASDLLVYAGWATSVVAVATVAGVVAHRSPTRTAVGALLVPTGLAVLAFAVLGRDWMAQARFATPVWALCALTTGLALAEVLARGTPRARSALGAAAVAALVLSATGWSAAAAAFARGPTTPLCWVVRDSGEDVNAVLDPLGISSGTLLTADAGGTALVSRLRLVDLAGLTDPIIARAWQRDDMAGLRDLLLDERRPTLVKSWPSTFDAAGLLTDRRFARDYEWLWLPRPDTGLWVRRDAVRDPEALVGVRAAVADAQERLRLEYTSPGGHREWRCPTTLTTAPTLG